MTRYWLAVAALALTSGVLQIRSALQEDQTWDEAMHLTAGFQYWRTGDFTRNSQHPPLAKLWAALPLLGMDVVLPPAGDLGEVDYGREFLFKNRTHHGRMLLAARMMMMAWNVCLILAVAWFTQRHFGWPAGLLAAGLAALDPNFLAHGHYVTTDAPNALFIFLSVAFWADYLWKGRRWALAGTGVSLGLALAVKFSAVITPLILLVLYFVPRPGLRGFAHFLRSVLTVAVVSAGVLWIAYMPGHRRPDPRPFQEIVTSDTAAGRALRFAGAKLKLPSHPFLAGVDQVAEHNRSGHPSYLLGEIYDDGRWYYFPVAFAVKTPLAVLIFTALSLFLVPRDSRLWMLVVPFAVFFAFCMSSRMNLGLRHLLPVYPFLFVWIGVCWTAVVTRKRIAAIALLSAIQVAEIARIHPHYLAFFNAAAGGPGAGRRYLVDSNLDWGQDLGNLVRWARSRGTNRVCLMYFGSASWDHYQMDFGNIPPTKDKEGIEKLDCMVASSATPLSGLYVPPDELAWLRNREPTAKIGWSIYVWDFRKKR
jgi:hypothetical protein